MTFFGSWVNKAEGYRSNSSNSSNKENSSGPTPRMEPKCPSSHPYRPLPPPLPAPRKYEGGICANTLLPIRCPPPEVCVWSGGGGGTSAQTLCYQSGVPPRCVGGREGVEWEASGSQAGQQAASDSDKRRQARLRASSVYRTCLRSLGGPDLPEIRLARRTPRLARRVKAAERPPRAQEIPHG